jgi:hypothetical protein
LKKTAFPQRNALADVSRELVGPAKFLGDAAEILGVKVLGQGMPCQAAGRGKALGLKSQFGSDLSDGGKPSFRTSADGRLATDPQFADWKALHQAPEKLARRHFHERLAKAQDPDVLDPKMPNEANRLVLGGKVGLGAIEIQELDGSRTKDHHRGGCSGGLRSAQHLLQHGLVGLVDPVKDPEGKYNTALLSQRGG